MAEILNWLATNSAALGILLAAAPVAWAVIQFILAKRAEAKRLRFETYHSLIKQLVQSDDPAQSMRLDRQIAVVFELRNFKHYFPVTLRILKGVRGTWSSSTSTSPGGYDRLIQELDLAIAYISEKV